MVTAVEPLLVVIDLESTGLRPVRILTSRVKIFGFFIGEWCGCGSACSTGGSC